MTIRRLGSLAFPLLLTLLAVAAESGAARARATHDYEIATDDGYGLQDCLAAGSQCGQVMADAYCQAHGQSRALAFGPKTAIEESATKVAAGGEPYAIRCAD